MSSIDFSNFFGSTANTTQSAGLSGVLSDYASIKNGSYGKLLKAYYKKQNETDSDEVKAANSKNSRLKNYASSLKDAASAVSDPALYGKGDFEVTYSDGTKESSSYDMDKIYEKVKSFIDNYNSTVKNAASYDDGPSMAKKALSLIKTTSTNANLLSQVGITSDTSDGNEGQLTIDEDKFKKASIGTIKTLFTGSGSYASVVENKASLISSLAESMSSKYSSYDATGSHNSGSSSLSSIFNSEV